MSIVCGMATMHSWSRCILPGPFFISIPLNYTIYVLGVRLRLNRTTLPTIFYLDLSLLIVGHDIGG